MAFPHQATEIGLAWTPVGGDILFIEATRVLGSGKLILTGPLGEVMRESAQAALSVVKIALSPWVSNLTVSRTVTSTSTCRPVLHRRTALALGSQCLWRWFR